MEHFNKIHEEFNVIKISEEALQYLEKKIHYTEFFGSNLCFKNRSTVGSCFCYRLRLRRNTQLESTAESQWNEFSLVTWSSGKGYEWLMSERKKVYWYVQDPFTQGIVFLIWDFVLDHLSSSKALFSVCSCFIKTAEVRQLHCSHILMLTRHSKEAALTCCE